MEDAVSLRNQVISIMNQEPPDEDTDSDDEDLDTPSAASIEYRRNFFHNLLVQVVPGYMVRFTQALEKNAWKWLVGSHGITWADIYVSYTMEFIGNLIGHPEQRELYKEFTKVKQHVDFVYSIPQISDWISARPEPSEADGVDMLPFLVAHTI